MAHSPRQAFSGARRSSGVARAISPAGVAAAVVAVAAGMAGTAPVAHAQDALGGNVLGRDLTMQQKHRQGGGSLDANSQIGSNRFNPTAPKTDFFSRNLIVTGDVAGGRGFRGNVGYREQSEFMGKTGADDNRQWDAYGVLSSPMALRAGVDPFQATQQYGAVLYSRSYSNAAARDILTNEQPLDARLAFDRFTADAMRMRRQADLIDAANPRDTAGRQNWRQEGKLPGVGSSPGTGAAGWAQAGVPVDAMLSGLGLTTYERQRLKQDVISGRTNREMLGQPYNENMIGGDASQAESQRIHPVLAREYTSLMDTMRARAGMTPREPGSVGSLQPDATGTLDGERPAGQPGSLQTPGQTPGQPPGQTPGVPPVFPTGSTPAPVAPHQPGQTADQAVRAQLDANMAWLRGQLAQSGPGAARTPTAADDTRQNLDDIALVLKHGGRMQSLVPEDAGYIRDMMQLGAESMRTGDFFRAEERFGSVLRVIPGHPLAQVGVANSQLGAGLSISAALTLRKLYANNPELIGTHFGPEVLPDRERMEDGLATARARLRAAMLPDAGPILAADRFDYGLLIGYIGFQMNEPGVIDEGLAAMRACNADDPLLRVLERVWLPEGAAPVAAPAAPAAP